MDTWNEFGYNTIVLVVIAGISAAGLSYSIKHNRDERSIKDREDRENKRNALKRIYEELEDTLKEIEAEEGKHGDEGAEIQFLKLKFHHIECEDPHNLREVGRYINTSKIKDIISTIKNNNKVSDWMEDNLPTTVDGENDGSDEEYPEMVEYIKRLHTYHEQLRAGIPLILEEIKRELDKV